MAIFPSAVATDSDLFVAVNALATQLTDNPLTIGATTVNVVSTTGFPTVGFISIDSEIIKYTGVTGTSFTGCTRGQDGTTAASHVQNSQVFHNIVAAHHNALKEEIKALESNLYTRIGLGSTQVAIPDGSVVVPSLTFGSDPDTGLYHGATNALNVSCGGSAIAVFGPAGFQMSNGQIFLADSSSSSPALSFGSDTDSGIYRLGANEIGFSTGGVLRASLSTTFFSVEGSSVMFVPVGSAASPSYSFGSDQDTGMYRQGENALGFSVGGVEALRIDSVRNLLLGATKRLYLDGGFNTFISEVSSDTVRITCGGLGAAAFSPSGCAILGTVTNDTATAGYVGEYIESVATATNAPTSGTYGDLASISLTAGDWDVSALVRWEYNGATWTGTIIGITPNSGNDATGLGVANTGNTGWASSSATPTDITVSIPSYRVSIASTTTYYLKYEAAFSAGTPKARGRISARRVR